MKFNIGDKTDSEHCIVLTHEFYRCNDAFKQFSFYLNKMIFEEKNNFITYKAYNSYADFIHHLYEFLLGCLARDNQNTKLTNKKGNERTKMIENYIESNVQRILDNFKRDIENDKAPAWVNHISFYDEQVPKEFAKDFREYRNKICGHVSYERSSKLSLAEFYQKYHKYLYLLYQSALPWWGKNKEIPDLNEITNFFTIVTKNKK